MVGVGRLSAGFGVMRRTSVKCTADGGQLNSNPGLLRLGDQQC